MPTLQPTYLTEIDPSTNTNKFYIMVDLNNGKYLAGWGRGQSSSNGTWKVYSYTEGAKKLAEKRRRYDAATYGDMPGPALSRLCAEVNSVLGGNWILRSGILQSYSAGMPAANPAPAKAPKGSRRRGRDMIDVWICPN